MNPIYLDNNATTKVDPLVLQEMLPYFSEQYANPSSMHSFGGQVGGKLRQARGRVAALLGCAPEEVVFTACGTESDNTAILSALKAFPERRRIVTTRVEHPAILGLVDHLKKEEGYDVVLVPVDAEGRLDLKAYKEALTPDTAIVSIMWANNETGVIFPIPELAGIAHERGILFHTDAVQAVGKIPMNLRETRVDMLSISGHKLHAPKGVGVLYVRKGTPFAPLLIGGHQERGKRAGTENTPGLVALGMACELALAHMDEENTRVRALRDRLEEGLLASIPNSRRNGAKEPRLPNTANISFKFVEGEAILLRLDQLGVCASSGSACSSGSLEPSHVLRAMGVPFTFAHGSIRFSLSRYTTEAEVDLVLAELPRIIETLRHISPFNEQHEGMEEEKPACGC